MANKPMHHFAFQVKGWLYKQIVKASSSEEALQEAADMAGGEDNIICFRKVSPAEANEIIRSWG
jgi:hypothetical protein